jgi:hypothetical protein
MNDALCSAMQERKRPIETVLREVVREELKLRGCVTVEAEPGASDRVRRFRLRGEPTDDQFASVSRHAITQSEPAATLRGRHNAMRGKNMPNS